MTKEDCLDDLYPPSDSESTTGSVELVPVSWLNRLVALFHDKETCACLVCDPMTVAEWERVWKLAEESKSSDWIPLADVLAEFNCTIKMKDPMFEGAKP